MRKYRDLEAYCESRFLQGGPYWHIYTPGVETPVLFGVKEDYVFMMNLICQSAVATDGMEIIAFEVMSVSSNFVSADFGIITISSFQKLRISRFRKSKFSET